MKKLGKYGKKVSCVVIGMLCAAAIGACGSTQSGSQDEKDVRNDISVYEEGADLEGTLTYGTLFIEPQTQHMIDLFMKEHPGVKIETKVVFDNDVTDEQYNEGLNTLLTELASDQRADIYDATYLPSEIKTKGSGYFEDLNQYIDADPNFNRDDYYDNILRAAEVDGKLYQIPEGFYYVMLRLNRNITDELNYEVFYDILDGQNYVPQHRERIIIVGFDRERYGKDIDFKFNLTPRNPKPVMQDILEKEVEAKYTLSDKLWVYLQNYAAKHKAAGNGFGYGIAPLDGVSRTISARYYKDGSEILIAQEGKNPRRLTPRECARLQGFPDSFKIPVSDTQAYRQFGNSVVVPLMENVAKLIVEKLEYMDAIKEDETRRMVI